MAPHLPTVSAAVALALVVACCSSTVLAVEFRAKSGVRPWVDVYTPPSAHRVVSSRGETWELVFSDEFNVPGRDFTAGQDYLWTALELPDGVNAALEYYSINMTSTQNDSDGRGVFQIQVREEPAIEFTVYNAYTRPPTFQDHTMFYRAGMVQSWNKFCFQGGYVEVSAQLPGAVSTASGNPDLQSGNAKQRVQSLEYYPVWPGIWFMGNLGRALFTASTNRMWPWSFNECDHELKQNQRLNACDESPGFGLNSYQGRGAPEIDLVEGGGTDVSTSIQVAPGMPEQFRPVEAGEADGWNMYCVYQMSCKTVGANFPGIPSATYVTRGHRSWYQRMRYAPSRACALDASRIQTFSAVAASAKRGFVDNTCKASVNACPGSFDGNSELGRVANSSRRWGINDIGGCMPFINGYRGSYLCDPDNTDSRCPNPRRPETPKTNALAPFNYQMDALSANTGLPIAAYTGYMRYQLEWVTGRDGYVRWLVDGIAIYEIPAESIEAPPQDEQLSNPKKLMIEEPMYIIFNAALSATWSAKPPNAGRACRGDGENETVNRICDDFPMYLKIDYIRVYQDLSPDSTMAVGCDPPTHPTKTWIDGHLNEYEDAKNKWIPVVGGAPCFSNDDCTVAKVSAVAITTGECSHERKCVCMQNTWGGPRCTTVLADGTGRTRGFGPSVTVAALTGTLGLVVLLIVALNLVGQRQAGRVRPVLGKVDAGATGEADSD